MGGYDRILFGGEALVNFTRRVKLSYVLALVTTCSHIIMISVVYGFLPKVYSYVSIFTAALSIPHLGKHDKTILLYTLQQWGALIPTACAVANGILLAHLASFDERAILGLHLFSISFYSIVYDASPQCNRYEYQGRKRGTMAMLGLFSYASQFFSCIALFVAFKFNRAADFRSVTITSLSTKTTPISTGSLFVSGITLSLVFQLKFMVAYFRRPDCLVLSRVPRLRIIGDLRRVGRSFSLRAADKRSIKYRQHRSSGMQPEEASQHSLCDEDDEDQLQNKAEKMVVLEPISVETLDIGKTEDMLLAVFAGKKNAQRLENLNAKYQITKKCMLPSIVGLFATILTLSGAINSSAAKYVSILTIATPLWILIRLDVNILMELSKSIEIVYGILLAMLVLIFGCNDFGDMLLPVLAVQISWITIVLDDAAHHMNAPSTVKYIESIISQDRSLCARIRIRQITRKLILLVLLFLGLCSLWLWSFNGGKPVLLGIELLNATSAGSSSDNLATFSPISYVMMLAGCQCSSTIHIFYFTIHYPNCFQSNAVPPPTVCCDVR